MFLTNEKLVLRKLLDIAEELIGVAELTGNEDFFSIGGDSLTAMHLVSRLARAFQTEIRVILLFENPVFSSLAGVVAQSMNQEYTDQVESD